MGLPDPLDIEADCHSETVRALVIEHNKTVQAIYDAIQGKALSESTLPRKIIVRGRPSINS